MADSAVLELDINRICLLPSVSVVDGEVAVALLAGDRG